MITINNLKKLSFLVYGLGITGKSVISFFKKNKIKKYCVWDDKDKKLYINKRSKNLEQDLSKVDYIILSPGVSLINSKYRKKLIKYQKKIITDIDLIFLLRKDFKSIVVTGTNGKSTTCKIIQHLLTNNNYKVSIGGNIGKPILNLKIKKNSFLVIEASSFQLAYSKYITPDFAILLNITNDHIDWHGNMKKYTDSKLRIFKLQNKYQYSIINNKLKQKFKKNKFFGKLVLPQIERYKKIKSKIKNRYIKLNLNDENMSAIFELSKILKIKEDSFINSLSTFKGLPHRYEVFLRKQNFTFINDSKATSFQSTKFALQNSKNIFWIVGGLPKKNDKIILRKLKSNIIKSYIIGKNINFFKKQIKKHVDYYDAFSLKNSILQIIKDKNLYKKNNTVLLSPSAASFDQYENFEQRGEEFKRLIKSYAGKFF